MHKCKMSIFMMSAKPQNRSVCHHFHFQRALRNFKYMFPDRYFRFRCYSFRHLPEVKGVQKKFTEARSLKVR